MIGLDQLPSGGTFVVLGLIVVVGAIANWDRIAAFLFP